MALLKAIAFGLNWRRARICCVLGISLLMMPQVSAASSPMPSSEYQIKAVFLFNFAQFAEWPARTFPDEKAPVVIGVLGSDPFGDYLDEVVKGEKIGARSIVVRRHKDVGEIDGCHILFVSRSESSRLEQIIASLKRRSVLTISDADAFTRLGGMVRFVMEDGKVRLRINVEAARACGLTISSKILRPATIVTTGKD